MAIHVTQIHHFRSLPGILVIPSFPFRKNPTKLPTSTSCGSTRSRSRPGWDSNPSGRFNFNREEDDNGEFGFRGGRRRRNWWSDGDNDDMGIDDDDDDEEFWGFQLFRSFGWMLPAIAVSLLLGTGPNAFLMALAVPLGQTALSLAFDKLWGSASGGSKPRSRTKKRRKPFVRVDPDIGKNDRKKEDMGVGNGSGYGTWGVADNGLAGKGKKRVPKFGGWDELDRQTQTTKVNANTLDQETHIPSGLQEKGKLSRRVRRRETPLFLRLLLAVFPFLGSWTRLFF